ncbi:AlbA family DNA-binding domain-containing protein [Micromonospora chokoriensis]
MDSTVIWDEQANELVLPSGARCQHVHMANCEFRADRQIVENILLSDLRESLIIARRTKMLSLDAVNLTVWSNNEDAAILSDVERNQSRLMLDYRDSTIDYFNLEDNGNLSLEVYAYYPLARTYGEVESIVGGLLRARGVRLLEASFTENPHEGDTLCIRLTVPSQWRVRQALDLGGIVRRALRFSQMDPRSPTGAYLLLMSSLPEGLLGQPESIWLEAKQRGYAFQNEMQKHEYALDIAALANTRLGGLLVIGMRTERDEAGRDVIVEVAGCEAGALTVDTYNQVAKSRVVPDIEGLEMHLTEWNSRYILAIRIPPQPDYLKPFIVRGGTVTGERVAGSSFTIPRRVGDGRWNMSAEAVHSLLVAARAALQAAHSDAE